MKIYLLPVEYPSYKANLSSKTDKSDGNLTAERLKDEYSEKGYSILATSDIDVMINNNNLSSDSFLFVNAYSVNIGKYCFTLYSTDSKCCNSINVPVSVEEITQEQITVFIEQANAEGFLVCIKHPAKSSQTCHDYYALKGLFGLEITNFSSMTKGFIEDNKHIFDRMLRRTELPVLPLAVDDHYAPPHSLPFAE